MSLEQAIATLNENVVALTKALTSAATSASAAAPAAQTGKQTKPPADKAKTTAPAYEPKHTKAEAQAAANEVKEQKGVQVAKALIKDLGYDKMVDIVKPEDIDKLYESAKEALGEATSDEGDGDGI